MSPELDKKLTEAFPHLYADRYADMRSSCMGWGFECFDGWYDILWRMSEKIEAEIIKLKNEGADPDFLPKASQVKEKWGTLRVYMTSYTDEIDNHINQACDESAVTCEKCGKAGTIRNDGWVKVSCDECYAESNKD